MELLRMLEGIRTPFFDTVIGIITQFGEETVGIVILCIIYWCINKRFAYVIGASFFLSGLTVQGAKIIFRIERPWVIDPTMNPVPSALERATGYSFPSGHTQAAASLFGAIGVQVRQKPIMIICFAIGILVAFSRMYLGVHTLLDVSVSLLIAFACVLISSRLLKDEEIDHKRAIINSAAIIVFALAVIAIALSQYHAGMVEQRYVLDSLKAAGAAIGFSVGMYIERVYIKFPVKAKSIAGQIVKVVIGLISVMALQEVLRWNFEPGPFSNLFRYFMLTFWITVIYPYAIKRFFPGE